MLAAILGTKQIEIWWHGYDWKKWLDPEGQLLQAKI